MTTSNIIDTAISDLKAQIEANPIHPSFTLADHMGIMLLAGTKVFKDLGLPMEIILLAQAEAMTELSFTLAAERGIDLEAHA